MSWCVYGVTGIAFQAGSFALALLLCFLTISVSVYVCVCVRRGWMAIFMVSSMSHVFNVTIRECMCASLLSIHILQSLLCLMAFSSWSDADALSVWGVWFYANYFHWMASNVTLKFGRAKK